jgi:predicted glycosyltransferase
MPNRSIVLLVKNGIGFGHIRRANLIASRLRALDPSVEVIIVSQAASMDAHADAAAPVINLPLLDRLPSNAVERATLTLLDHMIEEIAPGLAVEDTYPDPRYQSLASLRECRRALLLRRIETLAFERYRADGAFARYDRILLACSRADLAAEGLTPECDLLVELSARFLLVGPIHRCATAAERRAVIDRHAIGNEELVIVNAGAGGDHFDDAYCERLFLAMADVASRCASEGVPARFLLVLGPYYAGDVPPQTSNLATMRFEPLLHALLQVARVAVIRPGHNVLHEALSGTAVLVLVPGISWMEGQHEHAKRLSAEPGIFVCDRVDSEALYEITRHALAAAPRPVRRSNAGDPTAAAQALLAELDLARQPPSTPLRPAMFLLVHAGPPHRLASTWLPGATLAGTEDLPFLSAILTPGYAGSARAAYADIPLPPALDPEMLRARGVRAILHLDNGPEHDGVSAWTQHYHAPGCGILSIEMYQLRVRQGFSLTTFTNRLVRLLETQALPALALDASDVPAAQLEHHVAAIAGWLRDASLSLVGVRELVEQRVDV